MHLGIISIKNMIEDNKKLNPFIGIVIGVFLIFFGIFGMIILFGQELSQNLLKLIIFPIYLTGFYFISLNAGYFRSRMLARKIDKSAQMMDPMTLLNGNYIITKIRTVSDLYIVKFKDWYLHVIRMNEKTNVDVSGYRKIFGPKLPTILPLKNPVLTEFNNFKIRKCEGKVVLYDIDENQWISGQATMFSIFTFSKSMTPLLNPETFQNLINLIDQY